MRGAGGGPAIARADPHTVGVTIDAEPKPLPTQATVVVVTRNRREELTRALASCAAQSGDVEVIVIDDASTDGTAEAVESTHPDARIVRFDERRGYITCRNHAFTLARGDVVFSLDDDAGFADSETVSQTLADFTDERIGAVALSVADNGTPMNGPPAPPGSEIVVPRFIGAGFAIRKSCFRAAGGFPELLVHQGEEALLCLRLLALGYVVKLGTALPIDHRPSSARDVARWDYYGSRNDVLLGLLALPGRELPLYSVRSGYRLTRCLVQQRRFRHHLRGAAAGIVDGIRYRSERDPVPDWAARLDRYLLARKRVPLGEVLQMIPASLQT